MLEGERLFLRPFREGDAQRLVEICNDPRIGRFTRVPYPYTLKDAKKFLKELAEKQRKKQEYGFAIVLKDGGRRGEIPGNLQAQSGGQHGKIPGKARKGNGELIGSIGIMGISWRDRKGEIGYLMHKDWRGKGYMPEAVRLALEYAFDKLELNRVRISSAPANKSSQKVIEKVGGKFEGIEREGAFLSGRFQDLRIYSILKREFRPARGVA